MVAPVVSPSTLLADRQTLKLVDASLGSSRVCGTTLRRRQSGALKVSNFSWIPDSGRQFSAPTWFKADEADIREDFSQIEGCGRVRLSIGNLVLEGERFKLVTSRGLLLLSQAVIRSRNPLFRLSARRIRAHIRVSEDGSLSIVSLDLVSGIEGQLVLPWRGESKKFDIQAGRMQLQFGSEQLVITIEGGKQPAMARSRDGQFELKTDRSVLKYGSDGVDMTGDLRGHAWISGAGFLNPKDRLNIELTRASGFKLKASQNQPVWWNGQSEAECQFNPLEIIEPQNGQLELGEKLVLFDPGYGQAKKALRD